MEIIDIVDNNGTPTGETIERADAHLNGIAHRTAHIWILRKYGDKYQVLLQKRAMNKDSYPGCYDTSAAGHIMAGDEPFDSAFRELEEELGIKATKKQLHFAGIFHILSENIFYGNPFKDNEISFVYVYMENIDIDKLVLQKEEVESVKWFDLDYAFERCNMNDERFCVSIDDLKLVKKYLSNL